MKETVENVDLHKAVLNKTMTTQEYCAKYDFAAPLKLDSSKMLLFSSTKLILKNYLTINLSQMHS